jgi:hypothetical protein
MKNLERVILVSFLVLFLNLLFICCIAAIDSAGEPTNTEESVKMSVAQVAQFYADEIQPKKEINNLYLFDDLPTLTVYYVSCLDLYCFEGENYTFETVKKQVIRRIIRELKE